MTFASQIARQSSARTIMARVTGRRNVTADLVLDTPSVYAMPMTLNVSAVHVQGVALTAVGVYPTSADTYWHDVDNGILYTRSTVPNASTAIYIVSHRLYLCSNEGMVACDDPSTSVGPLHQWEPRLTESPSFGSFFDDVLKGVFSYTDLSLAIANGDAWFQQFLTAQDSFKSAAVDIWYFIDELANIKKMYVGTVTSLSGREGEVQLTVSDAFNRLREPAYMGDTVDEAYFEYAGFPNVDPNKNGRPCRLVTGSSSPYKTKIIDFGFGFSAIGISELAEDQVNEAVCTSFARSYNPVVNRTWGLHRATSIGGSAVVASNSFTSVVRVLYLGENDFFVQVSGSSANYRVGETFRWAEDGFTWCAHVGKAEAFKFGTNTFAPAAVNTGTDVITVTAHGMTTGNRIYFTSASTLPGGLVAFRIYYVNVLSANTFEVCTTPANAQAGTQINITSQGTGTHNMVKLDAGLDYNLYVFNACRQDDPDTDHDPEDSFSTAATNVTTPAVAVIVRYGPNTYINTLYCRYGADYDVTSAVTSGGGNRMCTLVFNSRFETNLFEDAVDQPVEGINPSQHRVWYAIRHTDFASHADLLKRMVESVGLTINAASFTQADTDLDADTYMQIPTTRETDYGSYVSYAQRVLKSTLGYLTVNDAGEVVYKLIAAPSPTFDVDENNSRIAEFTVDYNDIAKTVIFYNEDLSDNPDLTFTSNAAKYLHLTDNVDRFVHVLEDISGRAAAIFNLRKNRYARYKFQLAHIGSALVLGDDVAMSTPEILGGSGAADGKITGLVIGADTIDVEATDLLST